MEYSFIELGSETDNGRTRLATPVTLRDHDLEIQSVTARLNFQFYRDEYRAPPLRSRLNAYLASEVLPLKGR